MLNEVVNNQFALKKIPYHIGNKIRFIDHNSILYISACGSYCEIHIEENKKIVLRNSLSRLQFLLDSYQFVRIHRSTIVNVNFIVELINSSYQELDLRLVDNTLLRISKSNRQKILSLLGVGKNI